MNQPDDAALDAELAPIPGFLFASAAHGTARLLADQVDRRVTGGLIEIGVFRGKYFSVLARSSQATGERLLGIDSFVYSPEDAVHVAIASNPSTARADYRILARSSREVSPEEILSLLDGPARFVSVDGSHEAEDVYQDLVLTDRVLSRQGIVAVDDFLNLRALGVGEAAHRFLREQDDFAPFALVGNKLFVCRAPEHGGYYDLMHRFLSGSTLPELMAFRDLAELGPEHIQQRLYGKTLLVM